jgi:CubicO group peptidase (beta-lactamase class C family)
MNNLHLLAVVLVLVILSCEQQSPSVSDPRFREVRKIIVNQITDDQVPSIAVAVAEHRQIVWEEAFGWSDMDNQIRATPHTMYRLGSISKTITATGLMTLVEQGSLDLDKPISGYLSEGLRVRVFEGDAQDVTVRRILNHRAGIPAYNEPFFVDDPKGRRSFEETVRRYGIVATPPGVAFIYSNLGYQLAANIISEVSGETYTEYIRENVFLPLGMAGASVFDEEALAGPIAIGYTPTLNPIPAYTSGYPGDGDIFASAHDLIRFAMFHMKDHLPDQEAILTDSTIDAMQEECPPSNTRYGIGWNFDVNEIGYRSIYHGGEGPGVDAFMRLIPSEDVAVVLLCNAECMNLYEIQEAIFAALVPDFGEIDRKRSSPVSHPVVVPEELYGIWEGRVTAYDREIDIELTLDSQSSQIKLPESQQKEIELLVATPTFLLGRFSGGIPAPEDQRYSYRHRLAITHQQDRLYGVVTSVGSWEARAAECELSSRIELRRREQKDIW